MTRISKRIGADHFSAGIGGQGSVGGWIDAGRDEVNAALEVHQRP